jgi:hypothetical protein
VQSRQNADRGVVTGDPVGNGGTCYARSRGMTLITTNRPEEFAAWIAEYLTRYEVIVSDAKVVAQ